MPGKHAHPPLVPPHLPGLELAALGALLGLGHLLPTRLGHVTAHEARLEAPRPPGLHCGAIVHQVKGILLQGETWWQDWRKWTRPMLLDVNAGQAVHA